MLMYIAAYCSNDQNWAVVDNVVENKSRLCVGVSPLQDTIQVSFPISEL